MLNSEKSIWEDQQLFLSGNGLSSIFSISWLETQILQDGDCRISYSIGQLHYKGNKLLVAKMPSLNKAKSLQKA